jgi:cobalt-zinc-cadmium efflux system membrane fusion protein
LEVTLGLKEGETVAVKGSFILKSELKKGELEGDAH